MSDTVESIHDLPPEQRLENRLGVLEKWMRKTGEEILDIKGEEEAARYVSSMEQMTALFDTLSKIPNANEGVFGAVEKTIGTLTEALVFGDLGKTAQRLKVIGNSGDTLAKKVKGAVREVGGSAGPPRGRDTSSQRL